MKTPYFPLYVLDDLAEAGSLSLEEYGAYTRLRCHAWKDDPSGTLPDDDEELARRVGVTLAKWQELKPGVMRLFRGGSDGRWHHSGLRQAFEKARQKSKSSQASAKKRWAGERMDGGGANAMRSHSKGNADALREASMSEVRSQNQERETPDTNRAIEDSLLSHAGYSPDQRETLSSTAYMRLRGAVTRLLKGGVHPAHISKARKNWWGNTPPNFDQLADLALQIAAASSEPPAPRKVVV